MKKGIYSEEYRVLVKRLKLARIEAKLDQKKVAKILGKSQSYISKIEAGQIRLDVIQLKQFAKLYNKKITYFIG